MIDLKIQIISILFSFVFGVVFYILVFLNRYVLFNVKKYIQIVSTFLFMFDMSLLYFICIKFINNGIMHPYFLLSFLFGFWLCFLLLDKLSKK